MSQCYGPLAARYDALTGDVPYEALETWYETAFAHSGRAVHTVLDLCCGTGTLSLLLAEHGYEMICVDASEEMLSVFQQKLCELPEGVVAPMLLCQRAEKLDLYDTVDAAVCSLDGVNYMRPETLPEVFRRLHLFVAPGGMLVFDVNTAAKLAALDGQVFLDETEDTYCVWRTEYHRGLCTYYMDLFRRRGDGAWRRSAEVHRQRAYSVEELTAWLAAAGFGDVRVYGDMRMRRPRADEQRVYISCVRK